VSDDWVLDVTFWRSDAPLAFCPLDEDGSVISGLTVLASIPPGRMVGVAHADGQDAVEEWMGAHPDVLLQLEADLRSAGKWPT
jgi:hypothetical protein